MIVGERYKQELLELNFNPIFISDYARDTKGTKNGRAKLTEKEVLEIIDLLLKKKSGAEIARLYNVSSSTISHIKKKDTWTHLTVDIVFD